MIRLVHGRVKCEEMTRFLEKHHRHAAPLNRHMFTISAMSDRSQDCFPTRWFGIAVVDLCSSSWSKRRDHIELRRLCIIEDAPKNVASFLIGKARSASWSMGYRTMITYTQPYENGHSLLASGFWVQSAGKMSVYVNEQTQRYRIQGGLIQWVCAQGFNASKDDIVFTKEVIEKRNDVYGRWREKMDNQGYTFIPGHSRNVSLAA